MNILLGIIRSLIFLVLLYISFIFALIGYKEGIIYLTQLSLNILGFKIPKIYGKQDKNSKILVYNHPSGIENFLLLGYIDTSFLIQKEQSILLRKPILKISKIFNAVIVSMKENENTVNRMKESIEKHNHSIAISPHIHKKRIPISLDTIKLPKFRTGSFRIMDTVQPIVFLYDPRTPSTNYCVNLINFFKGLCNAPLTGYECFIFYLKPITRLNNETVESFAERTQNYMEAFMQPMYNLLKEQRDKGIPHTIPMANK